MESKFTGGLLGLIGIRILVAALFVFTLGLGLPWCICIKQTWVTKHTVIDGRRLAFDGTGAQLIGNWILWWLLCLVTLGIYGFWLSIKVRQWTVKHTHFADSVHGSASPSSAVPVPLIVAAVVGFVLVVGVIGSLLRHRQPSWDLPAADGSVRDRMGTASATIDAARESHEQNAAAADIRAIFAKAKEAEDDGNVNFCGFYVGMSKSDADALVAHYGLKDGECALSGDPVYSIRISLKGVRRITKGGNSYEELCQAVANRVGRMRNKGNKNGENREEWYEYKTIGGVRVTMAESRLPNANIDAAFNMVDTTEAERKAAEALSILAGMVQIPGKGYKMGITEVTQKQWKSIMGGNPSRFEGDDHPVENVSWDDCQQFLSLLNSIPVIQDSGLTFRLPTDTEWAYACRAGATGYYCKLSDGTEISESTLGEVAWFEDNSDKKTHPVGQKKPNAFGLYDMLGNVDEWMSYRGGASLGTRSHFGGCWNNSAPICSLRVMHAGPPSHRSCFLGFRLCVSGVAIDDSEPKERTEVVKRVPADLFEDALLETVKMFRIMPMDDARRSAVNIFTDISRKEMNRSRDCYAVINALQIAQNWDDLVVDTIVYNPRKRQITLGGVTHSIVPPFSPQPEPGVVVCNRIVNGTLIRNQRISLSDMSPTEKLEILRAEKPDESNRSALFSRAFLELVYGTPESFRAFVEKHKRIEGMKEFYVVYELERIK